MMLSKGSKNFSGVLSFGCPGDKLRISHYITWTIHLITKFLMLGLNSFPNRFRMLPERQSCFFE